MPSDIYVKQGSGWSTAVKNIYARTNSGWSSAIRYVYAKINAGWTRVWPLSGVYPNTNPFISNNTTTTSEISFGTVLRVGTTYKGDRGDWNPNGYTITSYDYKWLSFSAESGGTENYDSGYSTLSGTTNTFTITGTTLANFDRGWIAFRVRANASNSAYSGTADSLRYYVVRQKPILASGGSPVLSNNNPAIGDTINYSSGWNTTDAYKIDSGRSTIKWYRSASTSLTESQLKALTPIQSSTSSPAPASPYSYTVTSSDIGNYIYAMEEVFNSGTDLESSVNGVTAIVRTTSAVQATPNAFTYTISNVSSVTTPNTPTQTRVSSTSNDILFEFASGKPADTLDYTLNLSGSVTNSGNNTIGTLNLFTNSSDYQTTLTSSGNVSSYVIANGTTRSYQANVSTTTGAQSWRVNVTYTQGALSETFDVNTNSMPVRIVDITGATNPNVTINSITAYSELNQTGGSRVGIAGSPVSINGAARPTATSGTSTSNYTYYTNYQITGSQRRVTLPSAFTSGTTLYVSTNGYISWGGLDPAGATSIPSASNSGITVAPLSADLRQGSTTSSSNTSPGGLWYYADASTFVVTYWGNYYTDANQYARYQVMFYWGQSYADIIIVNNSLTTVVPSTTAVQNNANEYQNWSGTTAQVSTQLSTASMNRVSTNDGVDDNRTVLVASQPVSPSGGSASISGGTAPGTSLTLSKVDATGNPTPGVSWIWRRADGGVGGNSFTGGSVLQNNGITYQIQSNDVGYAIRAEVTWSNGVSPNQVVNTNSIVATAGSYTVTWNATANGGSGGGSTTQTAGAAHTAPSAIKTSFTVSYSSTGQTSGTAPSATQGYYQTNGYYDTPSSSYTYGPIVVGGSFTAPYSITMYARYSASSNAVTLATQGTLLRTGYTFSGWSIGGTTYSAGASYTPTANVTATAVWTQNVSPPSGGSVSISTNTGNYSVGSVITYSTSGWLNSPTSYSLRLHNGTNPVLQSDPQRASTTNTSGTYTITSADVPNYFKAWATATNSAGSTEVASSQVGPAYTPVTNYTVTWNANGGSGGGSTTQASGIAHTAPSPGTRSGYTFNGYYNTPSGDYTYGPVASGGSFTPPSTITMYARWTASGGSAPTTPTGLNSVYNGGTSYTFSWTAVSGATSYQIIPYHATSSTGTGSTAKSSRNFTSGSTYDSSADGGTSATYVSFAVRATNANGSSAYSAIYTPYR